MEINLEYKNDYALVNLNWSDFENVSLPVLKVLKVEWVPDKSLARLIENTKGYLAEINIHYGYAHDIISECIILSKFCLFFYIFQSLTMMW